MIETKTQAKSMKTNEAIALIVAKTVNAENLRQLAISPDGERVFLKWGDVARDAGSDTVGREGIEDFRQIGWIETNGAAIHVAGEHGVEHFFGSNALAKNNTLAKLLGSLQSMLLEAADSHRSAGKYGCCALALTQDHDTVESWIGTTEQMHRVSDGRAGSIRNVRLIGVLGAIGTRDNALLFTPSDQKGRITPANRWDQKADFGANLRFVSKVDLEDGHVVVTREDFRYQKVDITDLLARNAGGEVLVGPAKEGDGALYVGQTVKKGHVATIARTDTGQKQVRTYPKNGDARQLPAGAQAAFASA